MNNLICLYSSAPQSGKSTVAQVLTDKGYRSLKFAAALKDMLRSLLRSVGYGELAIEEALEGVAKEVPVWSLGGKTPRELMQTLGTDWGRKLVSPDLWIDIMSMRVSSVLTQGLRVVVDDMRFPNEYEAMRALGATMVRVMRPNLPAPKTTHPSEGLLDLASFDHVIINDHDVSALREKAYSFVR